MNVVMIKCGVQQIFCSLSDDRPIWKR